MPDALFFKEVKAKRFKDATVRRLLRNAVFKVGRRARRDYEKTVKTWETPVKFQLLTSVKAPGPTALVGTDSNIYRFVDEGTSVRHAHLEEYVSKTVPGILDSFPGGGVLAFVSRSVNYPGLEARGFSDAIQRKYEKQFKREMERALREAAKASGHAI